MTVGGKGGPGICRTGTVGSGLLGDIRLGVGRHGQKQLRWRGCGEPEERDWEVGDWTRSWRRETGKWIFPAGDGYLGECWGEEEGGRASKLKVGKYFGGQMKEASRERFCGVEAVTGEKGGLGFETGPGYRKDGTKVEMKESDCEDRAGSHHHQEWLGSVPRSPAPPHGQHPVLLLVHLQTLSLTARR